MKVPLQICQIRGVVIPRIKQLKLPTFVYYFFLQFLNLYAFGMGAGDGQQPRGKKPTIIDKLAKANDLLVCLDKQKSSIEERLMRAYEAIRKVEAKIGKLENAVECAAEEKMSRELRQKLWEEITKLQKEKKHAEKHLENYKRKLRVKVRKFKRLSQRLK